MNAVKFSYPPASALKPMLVFVGNIFGSGQERKDSADDLCVCYHINMLGLASVRGIRNVERLVIHVHDSKDNKLGSTNKGRMVGCHTGKGRDRTE